MGGAYAVRPCFYVFGMPKAPSRIDLLELDIDLRLADLWRETLDVTDWNLEVVAAFMPHEACRGETCLALTPLSRLLYYLAQQVAYHPQHAIAFAEAVHLVICFEVVEVYLQQRPVAPSAWPASA